jgi:hypothetical protein
MEPHFGKKMELEQDPQDQGQLKGKGRINGIMPSKSIPYRQEQHLAYSRLHNCLLSKFRSIRKQRWDWFERL